MSKSIFTQIRLGEVPGTILHEEADIFVIMTIAPHNPGHCLIIPIEEVGSFEDVPPEVFTRMMLVAQQLGKIYKTIYKSPKVALIAAGLEVEHTHLHLFPVYDEEDISFSSAQHPSTEAIRVEADRIRQALKGQPII